MKRISWRHDSGGDVEPFVVVDAKTSELRHVDSKFVFSEEHLKEMLAFAGKMELTYRAKRGKND